MSEIVDTKSLVIIASQKNLVDVETIYEFLLFGHIRTSAVHISILRNFMGSGQKLHFLAQSEAIVENKYGGLTDYFKSRLPWMNFYVKNNFINWRLYYGFIYDDIFFGEPIVGLLMTATNHRTSS